MEISGLSRQKVAFHTLGCKLNFSETSTIARTFTENGYERVAHTEEADVYVINTCSVTEHADRKCKEIIKKINKQAPEAKIAIVGCFAQLNPERIAQIHGVDLVLGTEDKFRVLELIHNKAVKNQEPEVHSCRVESVQRFDPSYSAGDRTRSFLKVQDGCDYKCTYCTIPMARGRSRNANVASTVEQAKEVVAKGYKEIILTGVNIGDFGRSTNESFFDLVQALDAVPGAERYRISSIEPNLLTDSIIEFIASESKAFLPHFHIPLQSGNNEILKLMRRRYERELYQSRVQQIKKLLPHAFIGVDVIVGFPGETEQHFYDTYNFVESLDVSFLHVFSYSERANTRTVGMPGKVSSNEKSRRSRLLQRLAADKQEAFYQMNVGKQFNVLFEAQRQGDSMFGFTENYIKVEMPYNEALANTILPVQITGTLESGNACGQLV